MGTKKATKKTKTPRLPRKSVSLTADGERLTIVAGERKDGTFRSQVIHRVGSGKEATSTRGMIEQHANLDAAIERLEKLIADAVKIGWTKKAGRAAKPTFHALPTPGEAA